MRFFGIQAVLCALTLAFCSSVRAGGATPTGNPYAPIVTRNVFGLNPPPTNAPAAPDDLPKITPNGIMKVMDELLVLYKVSAKGSKEESYMLSEGQGQDDIEVIKIDQKAAVITFNNHGTTQEIPLANISSAPAPGPGTPGRPFPGRSFPIPSPSRFGGPRPGQNNSTLPPQSYNQPNQPSQSYGQLGQNTGGKQSQPAMSVDEQMVMIAAQHLKAQDEGDPVSKIFPPTELDHAAGITPNIAPVPAP
jgi:hypothetical protein